MRQLHGEDEDAAVGEDAAPAAPAAEDAAEDAAPAPAPRDHQPTTSAPAESTPPNTTVPITIRKCLPGDDQTHTHIDADPEWLLEDLVAAYSRELQVEVGQAVPQSAHCKCSNYGKSQLVIGYRVSMRELWTMSPGGVVIIDVLPRPPAPPPAPGAAAAAPAAPAPGAANFDVLKETMQHNYDLRVAAPRGCRGAC